MIIIGLGSGRCGTASLTKLLNSQDNSICFHELNPSCIRYSGTFQPIHNTINEFQAILNGGDPSLLTVDLSRSVCASTYERLKDMKYVKLIGDIAHYYLSYVENISAINHNVRFVCLKRDREETVRSWLRKTTISRWKSKRIADRLSSIIVREPYYNSFNHWMEHDGTKWKKDPVWDKCFPKFKAESKIEAIYKYYDYYYERACALEKIMPEIFKTFEIEKLNSREGQSEILSFCGIAPEKQVFADAHVHKSKINLYDR